MLAPRYEVLVIARYETALLLPSFILDLERTLKDKVEEEKKAEVVALAKRFGSIPFLSAININLTDTIFIKDILWLLTIHPLWVSKRELKPPRAPWSLASCLLMPLDMRMSNCFSACSIFN